MEQPAVVLLLLLVSCGMNAADGPFLDAKPIRQLSKAESRRENKRWQREHAADIHERDIFAILQGTKKGGVPVRGWGLRWEATGQTIESAIDYNEWTITATKGEQVRYFHASLKTGGLESGQSTMEINVKKVNTPGEDWTHNFYDDLGTWDNDRVMHFVDGVCSVGHHSSRYPTTEKECFALRQNSKAAKESAGLQDQIREIHSKSAMECSEAYPGNAECVKIQFALNYAFYVLKIQQAGGPPGVPGAMAHMPEWHPPTLKNPFIDWMDLKAVMYIQ